MSDKVMRIDGIAETNAGSMYLYGRTIKKMALILGSREPKVVGGEPVRDNEMYLVDAHGIRLVR